MEGIKSDRPPWINKIERQNVDDLKNGKDITLIIRKQYKAMVLGDVLLEELQIKQTLAKNPIEYAECTLSCYYS
jgi:hypothetical protein